MESQHINFEFDSDFQFNLFRSTAKQSYLHSHDCLEIDLIVEGKGFYIIDDQSFPIGKGDIFIINNSEQHVAIHEQPLNILVMIFSPDFIWEKSNQVDFLKPFFNRRKSFSNQVKSDSAYYEELRHLLESIEKEFEEKNDGWQMFVKAMVLHFLADAYRHYQKVEELTKDGKNGVQPYERIKPAIEYIHLHYKEKITLDRLAKTVAMNRTYFSTIFSRTMNMKAFDYIDQVRINQSIKLLKDTDLNITEIAFSSGFNSVSYYNRVFKEIIHESPSYYRKKFI